MSTPRTVKPFTSTTLRFSTVTKEPSQVIVVANDITEQVAHELEMQKEITLNKALLDIMNNAEQFATFLLSYRHECLKMKNNSDIKELKRGLHTLKGNSSIFGLEAIFKRIHAMESVLVGDISDAEACKKINEHAGELESMMRKFSRAIIVS